MLHKPCSSQVRNLVQRAAFLEQVSGSRHDLQFLTQRSWAYVCWFSSITCVSKPPTISSVRACTLSNASLAKSGRPPRETRPHGVLPPVLVLFSESSVSLPTHSSELILVRKVVLRLAAKSFFESMTKSLGQVFCRGTDR